MKDSTLKEYEEIIETHARGEYKKLRKKELLEKLLFTQFLLRQSGRAIRKQFDITGNMFDDWRRKKAELHRLQSKPNYILIRNAEEVNDELIAKNLTLQDKIKDLTNSKVLPMCSVRGHRL